MRLSIPHFLYSQHFPLFNSPSCCISNAYFLFFVLFYLILFSTIPFLYLSLTLYSSFSSCSSSLLTPHSSLLTPHSSLFILLPLLLFPYLSLAFFHPQNLFPTSPCLWTVLLFLFHGFGDLSHNALIHSFIPSLRFIFSFIFFFSQLRPPLPLPLLSLLPLF